MALDLDLDPERHAMSPHVRRLVLKGRTTCLRFAVAFTLLAGFAVLAYAMVPPGSMWLAAFDAVVVVYLVSRAVEAWRTASWFGGYLAKRNLVVASPVGMFVILRPRLLRRRWLAVDAGRTRWWDVLQDEEACRW